MIVALCWCQGLNTWKNGEFIKKRTKLHSWSHHVLVYIPTSPQHGILGDASIQLAFPSIWMWPFSEGVAFSQNTKQRILIYFFSFLSLISLNWLALSKLLHLGKICAVRLVIICSIIFSHFCLQWLLLCVDVKAETHEKMESSPKSVPSYTVEAIMCFLIFLHHLSMESWVMHQFNWHFLPFECDHSLSVWHSVEHTKLRILIFFSYLILISLNWLALSKSFKATSSWKNLCSHQSG